MRILLISSLYGVTGGGAGIIAHHIANGLALSGHQISVITIGRNPGYSLSEEQGTKVYRFQPANLYLLEEKDQHPAWQKLIWQLLDIYNFHSANIIQKILANETPDIVHIHKMRGFSGAVWSVASHLSPGRVIQTCHDYESMSPDGLLRGSIGKMALRQQWPVRGYQLIRSRLSRGVSVVTSPSTHTLMRIQNSGLFPFAQSKVIANTHGWSESQLKFIHEKTNDISKGKIRFLFLGRLEREKGIVELCEAFLRAFESRPSVHLDIAGWGTLNSELVRKYGSYDTVTFLGVVNGRAKEEALRNATIVIVPSLVEEVFGLTVIEAYAFGKPVIASNIGGLPELVQDGETGWLVESGNITALKEQLKIAAETNPLVLEGMGQTCREYSYQFSVDKIIALYLDVYGSLTK